MPGHDELQKKYDQLLKDFQELQKIHLETLITRQEHRRSMELILLLKNQLIEALKRTQQRMDF